MYVYVHTIHRYNVHMCVYMYIRIATHVCILENLASCNQFINTCMGGTHLICVVSMYVHQIRTYIMSMIEHSNNL